MDLIHAKTIREKSINSVRIAYFTPYTKINTKWMIDFKM